jgi:hypothetical protein
MSYRLSHDPFRNAEPIARVAWCIGGVHGQVQGSNNSTIGMGGYDRGSNGDRWVWGRLRSVTFAGAPETHEINFWGGGLGFRLDKIVVTTDPEGPSSLADSV